MTYRKERKSLAMASSTTFDWQKGQGQRLRSFRNVKHCPTAKVPELPEKSNLLKDRSLVSSFRNVKRYPAGSLTWSWPFDPELLWTPKPFNIQYARVIERFKTIWFCTFSHTDKILTKISNLRLWSLLFHVLAFNEKKILLPIPKNHQ